MQSNPTELDIHNWQDLSERETLRVSCSHWKCQGKKAAFTITRTFDGCVYNCYRCGTTGAVHFGSTPAMAQRKLKEIRDGRKNKGDGVHFHVVLPNDFLHMVEHNKSIPAAAYAWLYQYEISDDDMYTYNIGYSPSLQRVVVPIYDTIRLISGDIGYKLTGWQGRDIYYKRNKDLYKKGVIKREPMKYYTEVNTKIHNNIYNNNIINTTKIYYKIISKNTKKDKIIIVEDILSAIKCYNNYKIDIVGLLNSTITDQLINTLKGYNNVIIWLDWDARIRSIKASQRCQSQGIRATTIRTKLDPKAVPYKEMPTL